MKSESKITVMPNVRFPKYENDELIETTLDNVSELIEERAGTNEYILMSVTSGVGLVSQIEKFGREIAGSQYKNYYVIRKWDFAYNKSATKLYPEGYISMLKGIETAAVPNSIFTCFRITDKKVVPQYLDFLFHDNFHGKWLRKFIEVGARAHGSLSIDNDVLFALPLQLPSSEEQQKIADCLSSLDDLISAETQKLDGLKVHKKGLMQQLFPAEGETVPKLRFEEFRGSGEWEEKFLKNACRMQAGKFVSATEINENKSDDLFPCFGGNGLRGYTKSFTHSGKFSLIGRQGALCGNVTLVDGKFHATEHAVVVTPKEKVDTIWLFYLLKYLNLNQYATGQAQPGLSVDNLEKVEIKIPGGEEEQQRIGECFSSLDEIITVQTEKIELLKTHKKGLMQGLFPNINDLS